MGPRRGSPVEARGPAWGGESRAGQGRIRKHTENDDEGSTVGVRLPSSLEELILWLGLAALKEKWKTV